MDGAEALACHLSQLVKLEAGLSADPMHRKLLEEWEVTMKRLAFSPNDFAIRGDRPLFETYGDHPLLAFSSIVRGGLYPPPELMLWLCAAYTEYLIGEGDTAIEVALFGEVEQRRGGGVFAHRINRDRELAHIVGGLEDIIFAYPFVLKLKDAVRLLLPDGSPKLIDSLLHRLRALGINQGNWIAELRPELGADVLKP